MNIGALIVLFKFLKDAGVVSPLVIGPPAPDIPTTPGEYEEIKPTCGPGKFAYQDPTTGFWTCKPRPSGR